MTESTYGLTLNEERTKISGDDGQTWLSLPLTSEQSDEIKINLVSWLDRDLTEEDNQFLDELFNLVGNQTIRAILEKIDQCEMDDEGTPIIGEKDGERLLYVPDSDDDDYPFVRQQFTGNGCITGTYLSEGQADAWLNDEAF